MAGAVKSLVMDSGPLIKGAKPETISSDVYTIKEVVTEIRDAATRQRLAVLPYELKLREPSAEAIKFVSDFAKKTGDYHVLSAIDVRVVALTYQLCKEDGSSCIRDMPVTATQGAATVMHPTAVSAHLPGFYNPNIKKSSESSRGSRASSQRSSVCASAGLEDIDAATGGDSTHAEDATMATAAAAAAAAAADTTVAGEEGEEEEEKCADGEKEEEMDGGEGEAEEDDDDGDSDDGEGWITPSNLAQAHKAMAGSNTEAVAKDMPVACMTTDYAMQNVLLQMGLPVLSVDGMVIRTVRSYVMRCTACMKVSSKVTSVFCPRCGNDALVRVVAHTSSDGQVSYGNVGSKALSQRGTQYSLPLPKGGRLAVNPVINPDQKVTYRPPRSRTAPLNALDADYVGTSSPFAMNDVTSRGVNIAFRSKSSHISAVAGQRQPGQKRSNPNAARPRRTKR